MQKYFTLDPKTPTKDQKEGAILLLMLMLEELNGGIKSRGCVDGSKHYIREGYKKKYATQLNVSN